MEAVTSSKSMMTVSDTSWYLNPEDHNLNTSEYIKLS
jgi:hypothetical protein